MNIGNHVVGGFVCTSVFASLAGYNVLSSSVLISATLLGSVIPDIDHPSSTIGRVFKPVSSFLYNRYGHRTLTHSFLFLLLSYVLLMTANYFLKVEGLPFVFCLALFFHVVLDMMTISGVEFFYPFKKTVFVMPENPSYRFSNNDRSSQLVILAVFLVAGIFMRPLMENGFWTNYNRLFGTMKHLHSENQKATDLIYAHFTLRNGSYETDISGYVLQSDDDSAIVLVNDEVRVVPAGFERVVNVFPERTGIQYRYEHISRLCNESFVLLDSDTAIVLDRAI